MATIQVPQDQSTIQAGINAAQNGDTVLVSPGIYHENVSISGKTITLASLYHTTQDPSYIDQTIIDGGGNTQGAYNIVSIGAGVGLDAKVVGFTLQNGNDGVDVSGQVQILNNRIIGTTDAIDFKSSSGSVIGGIVRGNTLENNTDDGIDINSVLEVLIEDNIVRNNKGDGMEIRLDKKSYNGPLQTITIRNNTISTNRSDGIQIIDSPGISNQLVVIDRNLIDSNRQAGVGLLADGNTNEDYSAASIPEPINVFNNTLIGNNHGLSGGDNLVAVNNIFVNHTNIAMKGVNGSSIAAYNLFWNNGTNYQDSNIDGGTTQIANPLLDANRQLQSGSPAIDAGTATFNARGQTVLSIPNSAYAGNAPDLGKFESNFTPPPPINLAPTVSAGSDLVVTLSQSANLDGTVTDDGQPSPPSSVTSTWTQVSGPGVVTFGNASTVDTSATFSATGTYVLRLTVNDSALSSSDDVQVSVTDTPPPPTHSGLYVSSSGSGTVGGVAYSDEDILFYDELTGTWSIHIDGSDIGLGGSSTDINAFYLATDGSILLSVNQAMMLPGVGAIDGTDIVRFVPSSTGANTVGSYQLYFDGSDVGLDTSDENIDAIGFTPDGKLVISVTGFPTVAGVTSPTPRDEDLLLFNSTALGETTSGDWSFYFDGSDVDLSDGTEDVKGVWIDSNSDIYLSTNGAFSITGVSGDSSDIFRMIPTSTGANTSGTFSAFWDGSTKGFTTGVDGFAIIYS
jgi:Right handed beta helix region